MQKENQTNANHLLGLNAKLDKYNNSHNKNNKLFQTQQRNVQCSSKTLKQKTHLLQQCCPMQTNKQHHKAKVSSSQRQSTNITCKTKQCCDVAMRFLIATRFCGQNEIKKEVVKKWIEDS